MVSAESSPDGGRRSGAGRDRRPSPLGRTMRADYEITDHQPNTRLAFRVVAGPARPMGTHHLEEVEGATTVHFELSWEPTGLRRLLSGAVARQMPLEIANLEKMKAVLEAAAR